MRRARQAAALTEQNMLTHKQAEREFYNAHLAVDLFVCPLCRKHLRKRAELRRHYRRHINPRG
jgi:hypothetical protein